MTLADQDWRRVQAALAAWYAPGPVPTTEQGDVEDMLAALSEPTVEAAVIRWAFRGSPDGVIPAGDLRAMEQARAAAGANR